VYRPPAAAAAAAAVAPVAGGFFRSAALWLKIHEAQCHLATLLKASTYEISLQV
jgi:hypothetical protein